MPGLDYPIATFYFKDVAVIIIESENIYLRNTSLFSRIERNIFKNKVVVRLQFSTEILYVFIMLGYFWVVQHNHLSLIIFRMIFSYIKVSDY